jgi:hypothetical protein
MAASLRDHHQGFQIFFRVDWLQADDSQGREELFLCLAAVENCCVAFTPFISMLSKDGRFGVA